MQALIGYIGIRPGKHRFVILDNISGAIKPGRMTLLLGPPGAGKSTLLKTLSDKMKHEGCKVRCRIKLACIPTIHITGCLKGRKCQV